MYLLGTLPYVKDTIKGTTSPNRVSWLLWSIAPFIGATAAFFDGAGWAAFPVFITGFSGLMIFVASFMNNNAVWKLCIFDYLCGLLSIMALVLWGITHRPDIAIIFAISSDLLASLPTLKKSWSNPETETPIVYSTSLFNALTSFFAFQSWGFSEYAFPAWLVIIDATLLSVIYYRRCAIIPKHPLQENGIT